MLRKSSARSNSSSTEDKRVFDTPSLVSSRKLYETAFTVHRMKRWPTGTADGLRAITNEDVLAHYRKYYRPSNVILTIVGAADREMILQEAVRLYADLEDAPVERDPSPAEPRAGRVSLRVAKRAHPGTSGRNGFSYFWSFRLTMPISGSSGGNPGEWSVRRA
jgi:predicted Zn-dependent peptidase